MPRITADKIALFLAVVLALWLTPGHGLWGWLALFAGAAVLGAILGILGRRFPWVYGAKSSRKSRDRRPRSHHQRSGRTKDDSGVGKETID
jgi:hypothetical protein